MKPRENQPPGIDKQNKSQPIYPHSKSLHDSEVALKNYYSHVTRIILKEIPGRANSIMDFGAGIGTLARFIEAKTEKIVDCVEIDPQHQQILSSQSFSVFSDLESVKKKYDLIYSKDTLEHIENDLEILKKMANSLSLGGTLVVYVPAMPVIFSELDEIVGHYRRYSKSELITKIQRAGFVVTKCHYVDSLGFFTGLILRSFSRGKMERVINVQMFRMYDKLIFPASKILDSLGLKLVAGKNLLIVAKIES